MKNKGFTLVELIVVIAVISILMLIGVPAFAQIVERVKVRSDKVSAAEIGKAICIREIDVKEDKRVPYYPTVVRYDNLERIEEYLSKEYRPQSMKDGYFFVTALQIEGIKRIRLSSVEPILFTDEFVSEVSKMDKVCPHYHLSLQSGCDETLKRMNRRYTTAEYKEIVDRLRENIPNVAITTDVIVGFPGETNDEFNKTYEFLRDIELSQMHVFKYSPRKGTPAATMENQVDPQMKQFRSDKLLNLSKENFNKFANRFIGEELEVLFETNIVDNKYEGLTPNYIRVVVDSEKDIEGQILKVKITDVKNEYVEGVLV